MVRGRAACIPLREALEAAQCRHHDREDVAQLLTPDLHHQLELGSDAGLAPRLLRWQETVSKQPLYHLSKAFCTERKP